MGSPLGPVLANIFMCDWRKMDNEQSQISPDTLVLIYRFADDTFSTFDSKDTSNEFLMYLNSRHNSIKFLIAEPHIHIGKKRKPLNGFSHGYHG